MGQSLKNKTLKGVRWSLIENIIGSGITFFVGIILARILSPQEFGIIGMTTIFIAISNSIVDSGFSNALIRKINPQKKDINTAFFTNLTISILLFILIYFLAPVISHFYNESKLTKIIRFIDLVLIFNAISISHRTLLVINLDFKSQAKASIFSSIVSGVIGIGMALFGYGIWSLATQQVSRQLFYSLSLFSFTKWRPHWGFSFKSFKELFGFGSKLMISGVINTIYQNIYYLIIGKFYTTNQLGQFTRAEQFNNIFSQNLTTTIQRVSYPALSSIQNEYSRLREAYRRIIKMTMLVTFGCMLGMAAISKPLILFLIGEKWVLSATYLQIMCFAGMLYPLHAINLNILQVKGRSDLFLRIEIYKKIIQTIIIVVGIVRIEFLVIGLVASSFISFFINSYYSGSMINYPTKQQLIDILPTFIISLITSFCMWSISFFNMSNWIILCIQLPFGIIIAYFIYEKIKLPEYIEIKEIIVCYLKNKSKI